MNSSGVPARELAAPQNLAGVISSLKIDRIWPSRVTLTPPLFAEKLNSASSNWKLADTARRLLPGELEHGLQGAAWVQSNPGCATLNPPADTQ